MNNTISTENKLQEILDFDVCKRMVEDAEKKGNNEYVILCPHYSINVASKFADCEDLQWDLDELSDYIGYMVEVSDYDDLVVDLSTDEDDEPKGKTFTYYINLDERGSFYADVRDEDEKTVFEIKAGNELGEDETSIFEDGYMKHSSDLDGLKNYLIDLEIMDEDDELIPA